jgi:hypothetical protein
MKGGAVIKCTVFDGGNRNQWATNLGKITLGIMALCLTAFSITILSMVQVLSIKILSIITHLNYDTRYNDT